MLKIKIDSDVLTKAIEYHTDEGEGMTVLIEDGNDLADWLSHILAKLAGYDLDELTTQAGLVVAAVDVSGLSTFGGCFLGNTKE